MGALDRIVAAIAARQHGVIARWQLLNAGASRRWIAKRLDKGSLIRVYRGVYRVGHTAPSMEAAYMAAVLACGEGSAISGQAAAALLGLIRPRRVPNPDVTAPKERRIDGIETHWQRSDLRRDVRRCRGIPVTTAARTLVDLAESFSLDQLAGNAPGGRPAPDNPRHVEAVLKRRPNAKGTAKLREVIWGDQGRILSELERAFIKLLKANRLPLPKTNRPAGGRFVDCRWPAHKLTAELDSYRYHRSRHAWEQDRQRERQAYARSDQFRRYTWADVVEHPDPTIRELRAVLASV
jgi:hypothetical protein